MISYTCVKCNITGHMQAAHETPEGKLCMACYQKDLAAKQRHKRAALDQVATVSGMVTMMIGSMSVGRPIWTADDKKRLVTAAFGIAQEIIDMSKAIEANIEEKFKGV